MSFKIIYDKLFIGSDDSRVLIYQIPNYNEAAFTLNISGLATNICQIQEYNFICNDNKEIMIFDNSSEYNLKYIIKKHTDSVNLISIHEQTLISGSYDKTIRFHSFSEIQDMIYQNKLSKNSDCESKKYQVYTNGLPKRKDKIKKY